MESCKMDLQVIDMGGDPRRRMASAGENACKKRRFCAVFSSAGVGLVGCEAR